MAELVAEANYASLISKADVVNSNRAIELFAKSEKSLEVMKGKDIIAFYGNTGSGKSTTVNYFLRTPLQVATNTYGEKIVKAVEDSSNTNREEGTRCKIGQSNCLS